MGHRQMGLSGTDQGLPGPAGKSHFRDSWLQVILPHTDIRKKNWRNFVPVYPGSKTQLGLIQQILADHLGPMAGDYFPTSPIAARKSA